MTVCRMCAVCRTKRPKNELLRIVKSPDGKIYIDEGGKSDGRGMYICRDAGCLKMPQGGMLLSVRLSCHRAV